MLYANTKFNTIKILIFKALSDSSTNHDKFISVNDELRKYNEIKKTMETYCASCKKNTANMNFSVRKT